MSPLPETALLLAGFTLAHAVWSVSDTRPEVLLAPLAVRLVGGQRQLQRFEAETQVEAITAGKAETASWSRDSTPWAFAREGLMREGGKQVDVILVDLWQPGMANPITVIQRFQRFTVDGRFRLLGPMELSIDGRLLEQEKAAPAVELIERGVRQHSHAGPLWASWR